MEQTTKSIKKQKNTSNYDDTDIVELPWKWLDQMIQSNPSFLVQHQLSGYNQFFSQNYLYYLNKITLSSFKKNISTKLININILPNFISAAKMAFNLLR